MASDRIAKNTFYLTSASVLQKILSFAYFAILAGFLKDDIGRYSYALTVSSLFIIFMDFGFGQLLTREGAKDEARMQEKITEIWSTKVYLIVVAAATCILYAFVNEYLFQNVDSIDRNLIIIATFIIIVDTITFTLLSIFRAVRTLQWEAIGIVIYQVVLVGLGFLGVYLKAPVSAFLGTLLVGSIIQSIFLYIILHSKTPYRLVIQRPRIKQMRALIAVAAPFAVAGIIYRLTGSIDTMMLKILQGNYATGAYALAFKLTFALTVLPGAFATSYYPAMSAYIEQKSNRVALVFENAMVYMALLAAPIGAGVLILGSTIIEMVWGNTWVAAGSALAILISGLPFVFFNYPIGNFLNAAGKQRINTMNMAIVLCLNIAINAWAIPRYSFNGAAVASTISSITLVLLGLPHVHRMAKFSLWKLAKRITLVLLAGAIMAVVVYFLQYRLPLLVVITIAAVVYPIALVLTRALTLTQIRELIRQALHKGHHAEKAAK